MSYKTIVCLFIIGLVLTSFTIPKPLVCSISLCNNWDETTPEKIMNKEYKKAVNTSGPHNYQREAEVLFAKAYLNYIKTGIVDTAMFQHSANDYRSDYTKSKSSLERKVRSIYYIALCFYYQGNYKEAQVWFKKYSKCNVATYPCAPLWNAKALLKTNLNDSANVVINNYCLLYSLNKDSIKALVNQDIKNGQ